MLFKITRLRLAASLDMKALNALPIPAWAEGAGARIKELRWAEKGG
jgi:hypothetical protein